MKRILNDDGMPLINERRLPLHELSVRKYLEYLEENNITVKGLFLIPNGNLSQLNGWLWVK
jgi:hypothetical protein